MALIQQPLTVQPCYNRCEITAENNYFSLSNDNIGLQSLTTNFSGSGRKYEISKLLQGMFVEKEDIVVDRLGRTFIYIMHDLFQYYNIQSGNTPYQYQTIRANIKPPYQDLFTSIAPRQYNMSGKFLTRFKKLTVYQGYERYLSYWQGIGMYYVYQDETPIVYSTSAYGLPHCTINLNTKGAGLYAIYNQLLDTADRLTTNSGEVITTNNGTKIDIVPSPYVLPFLSAVNVVQDDCTVYDLTTKNVYVKWINDIGGYEYYMFKKVVISNDTEKEQTYLDRYNGWEGYSATSNSRTATTYQIGDESLDYDTAIGLSTLQFAPKVWYYDLTAQQFIPCTIDSVENEISKNGSTFSAVLRTPKQL